MIENYENRALGIAPWPPVVIIKGLPGHPLGAIRHPRPELRERWLRMGVCKEVEPPATAADEKPKRSRSKQCRSPKT